mgnify:CR=1 FL=1|tara:strand:+ start:51 stop:449 length:399 start_codon:yes stop_codon:yes gene_type:complete
MSVDTTARKDHYDEKDVDKEVEVIYPRGTLVATIVVQESCVTCGQEYIGIKEEVAHLLAQHSIIHENEAHRDRISISTMNADEKAEEFQMHVHALEHIWNQGDERLQDKLLIALKLILLKRLGLELRNSDDE